MAHLASSSKFVLNALFVCTVFVACATTAGNDLVNADGSPGPGAPIAPPSGADTSKKDKQAADSLLNQIPGSSRDDSEVSIPIDAVPGIEKRSTLEQRRREYHAQKTDKEIVGSAHAVDDRHTKKLSDIDKNLGVQPEEAPGQAPSYTLGVQFVKELFKDKKYEDALIEVNDLLHYYPKSAQLLMMKGTLHQRMGQIDLALTAYVRASEYEPSRKLQAQIDHIKRLIAERESLRKQREGVVAPGSDAEIKVVPKGTPAQEEEE